MIRSVVPEARQQAERTPLFSGLLAPSRRRRLALRTLPDRLGVWPVGALCRAGQPDGRDPGTFAP